MMHSSASAKCSTVLSSGNYNMSQSQVTDDSKEYIFVKLTDSAYRAIEEYQRYKSEQRSVDGQCAKIQFIGNSGIIDFPTPDLDKNGKNSSEGGRRFGFAIDDVEGSLECIQQKQHNFDVLGSLSSRLRIHANEDTYDTIRTKMTIAEETEKSKCIREIRPNQNGIGRKVKKQPSQPCGQNQIQQRYPVANNGNSKESSPCTFGDVVKLETPMLTASSANLSLLGNSTVVSNVSSEYSSAHSTFSSNASSSHSNNASLSFTYPSLLSTAVVDNIENGNFSASTDCSTAVKQSSSACSKLIAHTDSNLCETSDKSAKHAAKKGYSKGSTGCKGATGGKPPEISCQKIRERLIHLLALKPYKKPELYTRLQNEGLHERERSLVSTVLKDISTLSRDNTYTLRRQMWHDVNENWPYYTEQERQLVKRRKPQHLTPPPSADSGTSTSKQNATPTHTSLSPPLVENSNSLANDKSFLSGMPVKKQRVSHYKKNCLVPTSWSVGSSFDSSCSTDNEREVNGMSFSSTPTYQDTTLTTTDEQFEESDINLNIAPMAHLNGNSTNKSSHIKNSDPSRNNSSSSNENVDYNTNKFSKSQTDIVIQEKTSLHRAAIINDESESYFEGQSPNNTQHNNESGNYENKSDAASNSSRNGSFCINKNEVSKHSSACTPIYPTTPNETLGSHFDQQQDHISASYQWSAQHATSTQQITSIASPCASAASTPHSSVDNPLYDFSKYTPIRTIEQRRQYKTLFESDYDEYLKLFEQTDGVAKHFSNLAARLENAQKGCAESDNIKQEIVAEYKRVCNQKTLKRNKQRFDYLHEKLAYIKQLVTDYDKILTGGNNDGSTT